MTIISNAFINGLLADAGYALDGSIRDGLGGSELTAVMELNNRMTPILASYIGNNFTVVTHIETDDVTGSGFDATVWKDNQTGKLFISMQGTTGLADFLADANLAVYGDAKSQIVTMVNWWLKISTPTDQMASQITLEDIYDNSIPPNVVGTRYVAASSVAGTGLVSAADLARGIEVNGHSLGGYLATAFTRLFASQANVVHTSTFNSAGFAPGSEAVFAELESLIGPGYGLGRFPNASEQSNYFAANGINVTTNSFWFSQQGQRVELYQEEGTGPTNHSMYRITDLLALGAALEKLAPAIGFDQLNQLSALGSNNPAASLERVLDSLRRALLGPSVLILPASDAGDSDAARVSYHEALSDFQQNLAFQSLAGKVALTPIGTDSLARQGQARVDFQTFVALYTLAPFIVDPIGAEGQAALEALWASGGWQQPYQDWKDDKANLLAGDAEFNYSNQWYEDRAALLHAVNLSNLEDQPGVVADGAAPSDRLQIFTWLGGDPLPGEVLPTVASLTYRNTDFGANGPVQKIVFGGDGDNLLEGNDIVEVGDHLYGEAGDDTLYGYAIGIGISAAQRHRWNAADRAAVWI